MTRSEEQPFRPTLGYCSHYRYLGWDDLEDAALLATLSAFEIAVQLFDYSHLEPLLATHIYRASAKGQVPFHPVSMYLLSLFRPDRRDLSIFQIGLRSVEKRLVNALSVSIWLCPVYDSKLSGS